MNASHPRSGPPNCISTPFCPASQFFSARSSNYEFNIYFVSTTDSSRETLSSPFRPVIPLHSQADIRDFRLHRCVTSPIVQEERRTPGRSRSLTSRAVTIRFTSPHTEHSKRMHPIQGGVPLEPIASPVAVVQVVSSLTFPLLLTFTSHSPVHSPVSRARLALSLRRTLNGETPREAL